MSVPELFRLSYMENSIKLVGKHFESPRTAVCAWLQLKLLRFQSWDTLGRHCLHANAPKPYKLKGMNAWEMVDASSVST